jgi:hypothetical protein
MNETDSRELRRQRILKNSQNRLDLLLGMMLKQWKLKTYFIHKKSNFIFII